MNTKVLTLLMLSFISAAFAEDFKTTDGKEYKDATVSRVEPDGIVVKTKSGISKLYFTELPKEVQERFHYDAKKGDDYSRIRSLQARYQELEKQEDDLLLKIGEGEVGTYSGSPNPLRSQLPLLHHLLDEVRHEKDQVRRELEQAQQKTTK